MICGKRHALNCRVCRAACQWADIVPTTSPVYVRRLISAIYAKMFGNDFKYNAIYI